MHIVESKSSDMAMSTVNSTESLVQCDVPQYFEPPAATLCHNHLADNYQGQHYLQQSQHVDQQDYSNQMVFYNNELRGHQAMNLGMDFYYISDTSMAYQPNQHAGFTYHSSQQAITTLPSFNTFLNN